MSEPIHPAGVKELLRRVLGEEPAAKAAAYQLMLAYMNAIKEVQIDFCKELLYDAEKLEQNPETGGE